jgi:hypothetical protein
VDRSQIKHFNVVEIKLPLRPGCSILPASLAERAFQGDNQLRHQPLVEKVTQRIAPSPAEQFDPPVIMQFRSIEVFPALHFLYCKRTKLYLSTWTGEFG